MSSALFFLDNSSNLTLIIRRANKPEFLPIDISSQNERDRPILDDPYLMTSFDRFAPITKNPFVRT